MSYILPLRLVANGLLRDKGPGIYHGQLTFPSSSLDRLHAGDGVIESASLVPYPSEPTAATHLNQSAFTSGEHSGEDEGNEIPLSMALTEWNMILLYEDRIRIVGLLSDKVVFEELLELVRQLFSFSPSCILIFRCVLART